MRELMDSMMRFSVAMTFFGIKQLRNTIEGVVDATRWTLFTGFTCPDCGTQQEVVRDLRKALDDVTNTMTAQLQPENKSIYENLSKAGADFVVSSFDAVDAVYPVLDDKPPLDSNPPRGFEKRSNVPVLDPRRFVEMGEELLS